VAPADTADVFVRCFHARIGEEVGAAMSRHRTRFVQYLIGADGRPQWRLAIYRGQLVALPLKRKLRNRKLPNQRGKRIEFAARQRRVIERQNKLAGMPRPAEND
jgi:hypothetical protein